MSVWAYPRNIREQASFPKTFKRVLKSGGFREPHVYLLNKKLDNDDDMLKKMKQQDPFFCIIYPSDQTLMLMTHTRFANVKEEQNDSEAMKKIPVNVFDQFATGPIRHINTPTRIDIPTPLQNILKKRCKIFHQMSLGNQVSRLLISKQTPDSILEILSKQKGHAKAAIDALSAEDMIQILWENISCSTALDSTLLKNILENASVHQQLVTLCKIEQGQKDFDDIHEQYEDDDILDEVFKQIKAEALNEHQSTFSFK